MVAVLQRVKSASVYINSKIISQINYGCLILLGVHKEDTIKDAEKLSNKISTFRMFADENKNMNLSIQNIKGSILVVSQFTLCANWHKGRRPSFHLSASHEKGERLYLQFVKELKNKKINVKTGSFGAMMDVSLINDGPVTFVLNSRESDYTEG